MNKNYFIFITATIYMAISLFLFKNNNYKIEEVFQPNFTFPFYKADRQQEYLDYKNKTGLSLKDSIIRVNIGLNYPFYINAKETVNKGILTLVNKYNFISKNYKPDNLIETEGLIINKEAYEAYKLMQEKMMEENLKIRIISAYRTYDYQENLYNNYLKKEKQSIVDTYSARPGYSEHHTGLAIDVDNGQLDYNKFYLTKEFQWMQDNAHKYGFILRYPKDKEEITGYSYEPWHYRYVGKKAAEYIKKHNSTYEEYYYEFIDI